MVKNGLDTTNPSEFEDTLAHNQANGGLDNGPSAEEQMYMEQMAEQENQDRRSSMLKDEVKRRLGKKVIDRAFAAGARTAVTATAEVGAGAAATAGASVIGPTLLIIAGVVVALIIFFVILFGSLYYVCTDTGWTGTFARVGSKIANWTGGTSGDVCATFKGLANNNGTGAAEQPPAPGPTNPAQDLINITGLLTDVRAPDPRLRECMLAHVQIIEREAKKLGITFYVSSAYRPGAVVKNTTRLSSHGKGEAIDLVLLPEGSMTFATYNLTYKNDKAFQKKLNLLIGIARMSGFKSVQGDTLDEYNEPTSGATGPHVHIEYNTPPDPNLSYCTIPLNHDQDT